MTVKIIIIVVQFLLGPDSLWDPVVSEMKKIMNIVASKLKHKNSILENTVTGLDETDIQNTYNQKQITFSWT